jgi:hypothetical protein
VKTEKRQRKLEDDGLAVVGFSHSVNLKLHLAEGTCRVGNFTPQKVQGGRNGDLNSVCTCS